jgi:hypothetical protein
MYLQDKAAHAGVRKGQHTERGHPSTALFLFSTESGGCFFFLFFALFAEGFFLVATHHL